MTVIKKESFDYWYGLSTEKAGFTSMSIGDKYLETNTGLLFEYTQNGWVISSEDVLTLSAGTAIIGKVGIDQTTDGATNKVQAANATLEKKEKPFRGTSYFSRPADANAYTALDAITNSTSAPSIMTIDLSSFGVVAGDFIAITNVRVTESTKLSGASINVWISPAIFTATNDNAEFSMSDAEQQIGGVVIPCLNLYTTALNSKIVSEPGLWIMQIISGTSIFVGLQAASGCTLGNNSRLDVFIEGVILK